MSLKLHRAQAGDISKIISLHQLSYPLLPVTLEQRQAFFLDNPRCSLEDIWVVSKKAKLWL